MHAHEIHAAHGAALAFAPPIAPPDNRSFAGDEDVLEVEVSSRRGRDLFPSRDTGVASHSAIAVRRGLRTLDYAVTRDQLGQRRGIMTQKDLVEPPHHHSRSLSCSLIRLLSRSCFLSRSHGCFSIRFLSYFRGRVPSCFLKRLISYLRRMVIAHWSVPWFRWGSHLLAKMAARFAVMFAPPRSPTAYSVAAEKCAPLTQSATAKSARSLLSRQRRAVPAADPVGNARSARHILRRLREVRALLSQSAAVKRAR